MPMAMYNAEDRTMLRFPLFVLLSWTVIDKGVILAMANITLLHLDEDVILAMDNITL